MSNKPRICEVVSCLRETKGGKYCEEHKHETQKPYGEFPEDSKFHPTTRNSNGEQIIIGGMGGLYNGMTITELGKYWKFTYDGINENETRKIVELKRKSR